MTPLTSFLWAQLSDEEKSLTMVVIKAWIQGQVESIVACNQSDCENIVAHLVRAYSPTAHLLENVIAAMPPVVVAGIASDLRELIQQQPPVEINDIVSGIVQQY